MPQRCVSVRGGKCDGDESWRVRAFPGDRGSGDGDNYQVIRLSIGPERTRRVKWDQVEPSIELNFLGEPFDEVSKIMPYCTQIVKCKAVCSICQEDARYTAKKTQFNLDNSNKAIQVGGEETYEARCQLHHSFMRS